MVNIKKIRKKQQFNKSILSLKSDEHINESKRKQIFNKKNKKWQFESIESLQS